MKSIFVTLIVAFIFFSAGVYVSASNVVPVKPDAYSGTIVDIIKQFFPAESEKIDNSAEIPTPPAGQGSISAQPATSVKNLRELFNEVGNNVGVPPKILEGVMQIESPSLYASLTDQQVADYSRAGAVIPDCRPNSCSAIGPMQMSMGTDHTGSTSCSACGLNHCLNIWGDFTNRVQKITGYNPNYCNLRDNVYAAAFKLKDDSGHKGGGEWTQDEVFKAGERYYGGNSCHNDNYRYDRLKGMNYCEYMWWVYTTN